LNIISLITNAGAAKPYAANEAQKKGIQKHQAVFSLDFETWQSLINAFQITESIIPYRAEEEQITTNRSRGWYG
jgi:non-structural maintenance of chromosomes element 4